MDNAIDITTEPTKPFDNELLPPPEDKEKLSRRVFEILGLVLKDKDSQGLPKRWAYYYKLRRNKHWKDPSKPGLVSANLLHAHRTRVVNTLTDNNPTFNVHRMGRIPEEMADRFDNVIPVTEWWWNETEQQSVFQKSVGNGECYGVTIEKGVFNDDLNDGLGEVETVLVDCFHFGMYPVTCLDPQKAEAVLHYYPISVREARRRWPDLADQIRPDREIMKEIGDERRFIHGGKGGGAARTWFTSISDVVYKMGGGDSAETLGEDDQCLIVECWVKDRSMRQVTEAEMITDDQGREVQTSKQIATGYQPAYKGNIRCVTVCNMGELVLSDRDNPSINPNLPEEQARMTYLWDKVPFNAAQSVDDTSTFWSSGDFEQLEGLQMEVNKTLSQLTSYKNRAMKLIVKNPSSSGVPDEALTNRPAVVIKPKNAVESRSIDYMQPPPVPVEIKAMYDIYKDLFMMVAGDFELERAQTPGRDVIAYKAIAALLEHAATMQRGKIRNYSKLIRERGRMAFSLMQNWYDKERLMPFTDPETGEEDVKPIIGTDLILPIKLSVVSGSTMPVSKVQEREEALALFDKQAIDDEELLKKLDWTDWRAVIKRKRAGPLAQLLTMLSKMGAPEALISFMGQLQQTDPDKFDKALKAGEIPGFEQLLTGMEPQGEETNEVELAEAQMKLAQADNARANAELTREKIVTERIIQLVKATGIKLDEEELKNRRAKLVSEIEQGKAKLKIDKISASGKNKSPGQGPYRERGFSSNNVNALSND